MLLTVLIIISDVDMRSRALGGRTSITTSDGLSVGSITTSNGNMSLSSGKVQTVDGNVTGKNGLSKF